MREAKLRFVGERVRMRAATEVVLRRKGRRSRAGTSVPSERVTKWGAGVDTNIELAPIKAVLSAVNRATA